jgi:hypothetical protein
VLHSSFVIDDRKPTLASSSFFSVDNKPWGQPFAAVTLNIIPTSEKSTAVIFSYPKEHSGKARRYIAPIMLAAGDERLLALSHMLIARAENFFMSPSQVDGCSADKRKLIESGFVNELVGEEPLEQSPELMLF